MTIRPNIELNYKYTEFFKTLRDGPNYAFSPTSAVHSFYPDYTSGLWGRAAEDLFSVAYQDRKRMNKQTKEAFSAVLYTLTQASEANEGDEKQFIGFLHSFNRKGEASKRFRAWSYNRDQFADAIKRLNKLGLVNYHLGTKGEHHFLGLSTLCWPTELWNEWLRTHCTSLNVVSFEHDHDPLWLKCDESKRLLEYDESIHTTQTRNRLDHTNQLRREQCWTFVSSCSHILPKENTHIENKLNEQSLTCRRIFKNKFRSEGRFYCTAQNLRKQERATLKVNGQPTVELDFKSLHPRMMYHRANLEVPKHLSEDCYSIPGFSRDELKLAFMRVANGKNKRTAIVGTARELKCTIDHASKVIDSFLHAHSGIANQFFKDNWKSLQFSDSKIADQVLYTGLTQGIPIMPVHDSFIVEQRHAEWLHAVMSEAYSAEMNGFNAVITCPTNTQ
ncbi:hypothetical protein [Reinekea blandensis]|uniref:Uncharacterized protein n=1 Tax=Reinekea blandensis MED297 TaxID=314283 RepID=A4BBC9_9GAMM|nr:hypothetical protein [Reinekea blandensis]EAR10742.1 hypothetical protein MED297_12020 [Reinekea sp. MED297] [Reinekea blandensis MED297]